VADELIAAAAPGGLGGYDPARVAVEADLEAAAGFAAAGLAPEVEALFAVIGLRAFLTVKLGVAFADDESPAAVVQVAINALRGELPGHLTTASELAWVRTQAAAHADTIATVTVLFSDMLDFMRDHFGVDPSKIEKPAHLFSAIKNQFRTLNAELVKAKRGATL
jgi:hypothetical protein